MYACATTFMTSVVTCAILYVGNSLVSEGSLTTGTLVSFLLYQYNLTGALSSIVDIWSGMQEAIGSARKIFSILDRQPALRSDGTFYFLLPLLETTFFILILRSFLLFVSSSSFFSGTLAPRVQSQNAMVTTGNSRGKTPLFVGRIDVVNVTFAYPSRPEARQNHQHASLIKHEHCYFVLMFKLFQYSFFSNSLGRLACSIIST